jgi:hypothetical protein
MSGKQTNSSFTMQEGNKQDPVAESQLSRLPADETDLGSQLKSLNLRLNEIALLVDQISQELGGPELNSTENAASDRAVSVGFHSTKQILEPASTYRLCALMDLLRKHYGFDHSGIFSRDAATGQLEAQAVSPHPDSAEESQELEEQVGILWRSRDIQPAIEQQRRLTLAAPQGGCFLVIPLGTGDRRSRFWVMYFRESSVPEKLSAEDMVLWTEILDCCLEGSGLSKPSVPFGQDGSSRVDRERIWSTVRLGRALTHEINNPLQVIMGRTQLLKMNLKKSSGQSHDEILDIIEASAGKICSLVKDFSDHLHRQSDEITDGKEVNLLHILESDLPLLKYLFNSRRITLDTNLKEKLPSVSGNPGELETAILILMRELEERLSSGGSSSIRAGVENETVFVDLKGSAKDPTTQLHGSPVMSAERVRMASAILERFGASLQAESPQAGKVNFRLSLAAAGTQVKEREPGLQPATRRQATL